MPLDLLLDFAPGLDPAVFAEDRLGFRPDPWQSQVLRSPARWILLNCCRQSGKSTTTALVALHTAIYDPGLILLVSPSLRQSKELFAKTAGFLKRLEPVEELEEDNKSSCTLANGARVVSLPGDPDTLRGYSAPKLIIKRHSAKWATAEAKEVPEKAIAIAPAAFDRYVRGRVPFMRPEDHAHMLEGLRKAGW